MRIPLMIITKKVPYKLWKGDQEIKTSGLPCVSRVGPSTIIVMTRIANCFRNDYELTINKKQNVQLKLVKVSSTASWGGGGGTKTSSPLENSSQSFRSCGSSRFEV